MTLKLEFETDNSAFNIDMAAEVSRILHEIAERIAGGTTSYSIRDIDGNLIGRYELQEAE